MEADIYGEDEVVTGVNVIDNIGVEHDIQVERDGSIYSHHQDGYPDNPEKRTPEEGARVEQARRFGRYWVYRKRGYETLEPWNNPDRLVAATIALAPLTEEVFDRHFGELHRHFQSLETTAESPLDLPEDVDPFDVVYQQDVYLGLGGEPLDQSLLGALTDPEVLDLIGATVGVGGERTAAAEVAPELHEVLAAASGTDAGSLPSLREGLLIEAVSGVHVQVGSIDEGHTKYGTQPDLDREPDAKVELYAYDKSTLDSLQIDVARRLLCQIRDCYLLMGIAPPPAFRIQGPGKRAATGWYNTAEFYDFYADPQETVTTWFEAETPDGAYEHEVVGRLEAEP